ASTGYGSPSGTKKQTTSVSAPSLYRPMPFHYAGTGTIDGIPVYRFVEQVPPTLAGSQKLPGALVGMKQSMVTLPMYYATTNTYWVDPKTGGALNTTQDQKQTLQDATTGPHRLLLFDGKSVMTPQSVRQGVNLRAPGGT